MFSATQISWKYGPFLPHISLVFICVLKRTLVPRATTYEHEEAKEGEEGIPDGQAMPAIFGSISRQCLHQDTPVLLMQLNFPLIAQLVKKNFLKSLSGLNFISYVLFHFYLAYQDLFLF